MYYTKFKYLISFLFVFFILSFTGCGGGGGGNSSSSTEETITVTPQITGYFLDSAVAGIKYECGSSTGTTTVNGTFNVEEGCGNITFTIGGVLINTIASSSLPSDEKLYITDLIGVDRNDTNNSDVVNVARFLQSLDDDNNPYNGINITSTVSYELKDSTLNLSASPTLNDLNSTIENLGRTLISEDDAVAHFTYTLNSDLGLEITGPPPPAPILTTTPTMTNTNATTVEVNGQPETSIFVNGVDINTTIPVTSKINIDLDTTGSDGNFSFNIMLQDSTEQNSSLLSFTILKDTVSPTITSSDVNISEGSTTAIDIDATDTNTLTYSISGIDASAFDINSSNGLVTFLSPTGTDYEYPTDQNKDNIYYITANVTDGVNTSTKNLILTVTNTPETAPVLSAFTGYISENASTGDTVGTISFTSGDTSITNFDINETNGSVSSDFEVSNAGVITVKSTASLDYETKSSYSLTATATNSFGNSNTATVIIHLNNVIDTPPTLTNFAGSVNENSTGGTTVGNLVINSTGDSAITSISLKDGVVVSSEFQISTTGEITVKNGANLDYETKSIYNLTATATNSFGDANATVMIVINDLENETPPTLTAFSGSIDENATDGTTIGTISATAGDSSITSYTITGTGSGNFEINASNNVLSVASGATLDYETTTSYPLTVYATNDAGNSNTITATVNINNIAETAPTLTAFSGSVSENASTGDTVGTISFTSGDTSITNFDINETNGSVSSDFEVSNAGVITVKSTASLDYETKSSYSLTATATNSFGNSNTVTVTISLNDIVDTVPTITNFTGSVNENSTGGTSLGSIVISSLGDSAITKIDINETNGTISNEFVISTTGAITVKNGASLDYETKSSYDLRAIAYNATGGSNEANVTISIIDVAETSPTIQYLTVSVDENATVGTILGDVNITSVGDSNITSFTITGNGAGNFDINTSGHVTVSSGASLDYETATNYSLTMYATNVAGNGNSVNLNVNVNNINDVVPIIDNFVGSVNENSAANSIVGKMSITQGDSDISSITLTKLDGNVSTNFQSSTDGTITVKSGASLDYETNSTYQLQAIAITPSGNSSPNSITINILNVSEVPPTIQALTASVDENATVGTLIGNITITDAGDSSITSFTLSGSGSGNFDINTSGHISVKSGSTLDYETTPSYALEAFATNGSGNSQNVNITININDIPEIVPILNNFSGSVEENATVGTLIGQVTLSNSPDSNITSFNISGTDSNNFDINSSGHITLDANVSYPNTFTFDVNATNTAGTSSNKTVTIEVIDMPTELPVLSNFSTSINENIEPGTVIGQITIQSGDTAITDINFTAGSQSGGSDDFVIDTNGTIKVASGAIIDYETRSIYDLRAEAFNAMGKSNLITVYITVNDILEINLYIASAIYDNNNTTSTVDDDSLYLFFSKTVKESTFASDPSVDYNITNGAGAIGSGSTTTYEDNLFHLQTIKGDNSTGSIAFEGGTTKIAIMPNELTDTNDTAPYDYNITTVLSLKHTLKTGQIGSYDQNGTEDNTSVKDDYYYNTGADRNFTRDGTKTIVYDNTSGLVWDDSTDTTVAVTWTNAKGHCENQSNFTHTGMTGWRLPTRNELFNLVDRGKYSKSIDSIFVNTNASFYWSDTVDASNSDKAWMVSFSNGSTTTILKTEFSSRYVRCVRTK